jgi:hypothetical protein
MTSLLCFCFIKDNIFSLLISTLPIRQVTPVTLTEITAIEKMGAWAGLRWVTRIFNKTPR